MKYGLQMYSVRDVTETDLYGALKQVAALGYENVEFAGFFGRSSEQVNKAMNDAGIRICGTHSGWADLANDYENKA